MATTQRKARIHYEVILTSTINTTLAKVIGTYAKDDDAAERRARELLASQRLVSYYRLLWDTWQLRRKISPHAWSHPIAGGDHLSTKWRQRTAVAERKATTNG